MFYVYVCLLFCPCYVSLICMCIDSVVAYLMLHAMSREERREREREREREMRKVEGILRMHNK